MGFKENLIEEMKFQGINQKELASKAGISVNTLRNYINGHNALPSIETGVKIASVLGVSAEFLVNKNIEQPNHYQKIFEDFNTLRENDKKSVIALIQEMKKHN